MCGYGCTRLSNEPFASEKGLKKDVTHAHGKAVEMLYVDEGAVPPAGAGSAANGDAFGAFQKLEKEDCEDVEEEEEEEDDFRVVVRSGPGARSLRTDKDATEMDTSDDEDDRGAAHSPPRRGRNITRFAAGVGAATEDGDVDSETLNREAIAAGRKRGSSALGSKLEQGRAKSARGERGDDEGTSERGNEVRKKMECPLCAFKFASMQGVPAHYKMHIKRGTNIERTMAEKLLAEFTETSRIRKEKAAAAAALKNKNKVRKAPASKLRRGSGRPAPDASDSDAAEAGDDEPQQPLLLQSSARNCTTCGVKRFKTQTELIKHMGDVHGVVAIDEEQYAAWRAANEAEDPAGGTPAQNGGHQGEGGAFALAHAGASGAGPSWGGDSWQAAAVAGAGNGALVHQPQYGAGDAGSGGQNVVIPADLVANMLERLQSAEQRNAALEQRLAVMEKANALAHGRQFPPFDPTAEIKRVAIKNAKPGYSPIVIFGRMVWVTGIVALNTVNQDVEHQTNQALEHMKTLLHKAGTNTRHLLKVNIYLSDIRTVDACHRAWEQFFAAQAMGDEERPVRITHQTVLKEQSYRVEVHAEAVLPADK